MSIDTSQPPTVHVTGIVRAPVDKVWALFRPFGEEIMTWWDIYEWVKLEDPGTDEVGAVRHFLTKTGRTYREKLAARDDENHTEQYDMLSVSPSVPTFEGATTKVSMVALADGTTQVTWQSWSVASSVLLGQIKATQSAVYEDAIKDLDRHFNPALGTVDVQLVKATGLKGKGFLPVDAYVVLHVDNKDVQRSNTRRFTNHPVFNETLTLDILKAEGELEVGVWDANLGRDDLLGEATFDMGTLTSGKATPVSLDLGGGATLDLVLTLKLVEGDKLPDTAGEQAIHALAHIESVINELKSQALAIATQVAKGNEAQFGYDRYPRSPQLPDVPLENLPRMVHGLPRSTAMMPNKLSRMMERGIEYLYSEVDFIQRAEANEADPARAFFGGWVEPFDYLLEHWTDDAELTRQFLAGVCPMVIARVTDAGQLPASFAKLTPGGESIADLIARQGLYLLDYAELEPLDNYRDMFFYAPYVLVYKPKDSDELTLAAIQLERSDDAVVYEAGKTPPNRWMFAKLHVACADNQYHQWIYHLGFAHLAVEPFAIAFHNALPEDHAIHKLLAPHFHDTIGINFLARQTLVSTIAPFTDRTFSTGTAQALKMFLNVWEKYDFFSQTFPAQLAARGFDLEGSEGLKDYHYRDDGAKLWKILGDYVTGVVNAVYADDAAVVADEHIQAWAKESTDADKADIPGFPKAFDSRQVLVDALQAIIWTVSAHHSAVNFSQYDYLSYVPNRPDSLFRAMPEGTEEIDSKILREALPSVVISHFQISFAYLLTLPSHHPLTDVTAMSAVAPDAAQAFSTALEALSASIQSRNEALVAAGKAPYPYLDPAQVASSVAI